MTRFLIPCRVLKWNFTQPTLSMQIRSLEEELGLRLFDRSRTPVVPTEEGVEIIAQARTILREVERVSETVQEKQGKPSGTLTVGIIPTLAPYLLPRFLGGFLARQPDIRLVVSELTTEVIVDRLRLNLLDAGLLVTHRPVVKQRLLDALQAEILRSIPRSMQKSHGKDVLVF